MLALKEINITKLHAAVSAMDEQFDLEDALAEFWEKYKDTKPTKIKMTDEELDGLCHFFGEVIDGLETEDMDTLPEVVTEFYNELFSDEMEGVEDNEVDEDVPGTGEEVVAEEETVDEEENEEPAPPVKAAAKKAKPAAKAPVKAAEKKAPAKAKAKKAEEEPEEESEEEQEEVPTEKKAPAKAKAGKKAPAKKEARPKKPNGDSTNLAKFRGADRTRFGCSVGSGTEAIDNMLEKGTFTKKEIAEAVGTPENRVQTRIYALKSAHHVVQGRPDPKKKGRILLKLIHADDYKPTVE